jgi:predicted permease
MSTLLQEVQYALRRLINTPAFSLVALLTLALGIGSTTAIFTLVDRVVLRPLPYPRSDRLVEIGTLWPKLGPEVRYDIAPANYFYFRDHSRTLREIGVYQRRELTLTGDGPAMRVDGIAATPSLMEILGARPVVGRVLTEADDLPSASGPQAGSVLPGPAAPVAILSHAFWVTHYGSDPNVVGRLIEINGNRVPVAGVLDEGFEVPGEKAQIWLPLGLNPSAAPTNWHQFSAIARLRDGVTVDAAERELESYRRRFPELFPEAYSAAFMDDTGFRMEVESLQSFVVGGIRNSLWVLLASVALVLLIACGNVANLFFVRAESRRREVAVRSALGADRWRLILPYLAESLLLTLAAGAIGIELARLALQLVVYLSPGWLPRIDELRIGWESVAFTATVSVFAGTIFGLLPLAHRARGTDVVRTGNLGSTPSRHQHALRGALIVGQVAFALMLLAAAGVMIRSFVRLTNVDPGIEPEGVLTMEISLPGSSYVGYERVAGFHRELLSRLEGLPGVTSASLTDNLPLSGYAGCNGVFVEDTPPRPDVNPPCAGVSIVAPGFFQAMGIPVEGRAPEWSDLASGSGAVVVSRALAQSYWPGQNAIGKGIRGNGWGKPFYRVVGVAEDVRFDALDKPAAEMVYFPMVPLEGAPLWSPPRSVSLVIRSDRVPPESLAGSVRSVLAELDPNVPIAAVRTMNDVVSLSTARVSFVLILLGIAAVMALVLSAVGLYGVLTFIVGQRTSEFGIRLALGASGGKLARGVLLQSGRLALIGVVLGTVGALLTMRAMRSLLFEISPTDPATLGAAAVLLIAVALLAAYLPARRATRVDPMVALRAE